MITLKIEVGAIDFAKAYEILKSTLAMCVDSISRMDGSSTVTIEEFNDESGRKIGNLLFSKESKKQDIHPTTQPTETCRWKGKSGHWARTPHEPSSVWNTENMYYCPTCGKRIEVVE